MYHLSLRHMITTKSVNKINEEIDGLTDEQLDQAIDRLFDAQPEVLAFLDGFSRGDGEILELATLLSFFVFKAYELRTVNSNSECVPAVSAISASCPYRVSGTERDRLSRRPERAR